MYYELFYLSTELRMRLIFSFSSGASGSDTKTDHKIVEVAPPQEKDASTHPGLISVS